MKVSYKWLSEYVDLHDITPKELADRLTLSGVAVDIVEERNKGVENVVVGYVVERERHPDADKLSVCKVDVGSGELLQIVCGAPNVAAGQKVPVALVGAKLPGGIKIKRAKLRGVESQGMICSARELGIDDRLLPKELQEGIYVLPADVEIGQDVVALLSLDDAILELDLTPNRSDCLSMIGVAYEVAAILDREVRLPLDSKSQSDALQDWQVEIESDDCLLYTASAIHGVTIAPSPLWMQHRLMAAGIRPINNIVDVTNYVMLEYGQPLHAFDADKVKTGKIVVRQATSGEKLTTLDGVERTLDSEMLVITDGERPIALAGVMGGENTEVSDETHNILLESAYFHPISVRKTSKKLGLRSESSLRFEKGIDPRRVVLALERAATLMAELGGGTVQSGIAQTLRKPLPEENTLTIKADDVNNVLGTSLSLEQVQDVFHKLRFAVEAKEDTLYVTIPTRRPDITLKADLIEEVARIVGYDQIPTTLPNGESTAGGLTALQKLRREIRRLLESVGYHQAITYTLTEARNNHIFQSITAQDKAISVAMPMSEERSVLRMNLLPSLLQALQYNANRNIEDLALYEVGKVFSTSEEKLTELPKEENVLAGVAMGKLHPSNWSNPGIPVDFFVVKGVLEQLFERLGIQDVQYVADEIAGLHPGRGAWIEMNGERIGYLGQLHPELQKQMDVKTTIVFQIKLDSILNRGIQEIEYHFLPRYPAIRRDIALVVDENVPAGDLLSAIRKYAGEWLEQLDLFDLYQGEHIQKGKKSIAFSLVYRHPERTLLDEEVQAAQERILQALCELYQAEIRS